jgi:hypothetical protein
MSPGFTTASPATPVRRAGAFPRRAGDEDDDDDDDTSEVLADDALPSLTLASLRLRDAANVALAAAEAVAAIAAVAADDDGDDENEDDEDCVALGDAVADDDDMDLT